MYMPLMVDLRKVLLLVDGEAPAGDKILPAGTVDNGPTNGLTVDEAEFPPIVREKLRSLRPFLSDDEELQIVRQGELHKVQGKTDGETHGDVDWDAVLLSAKRTDLVVSCLSDDRFNASLLNFCREHGILCNVADRKDYCNTWFMGIARTDSLLLGVSSKGKCPYYAARLRRELQKQLEQIEPEARLLSEARKQLREKGFKDRGLRKTLRQLHQSAAFAEIQAEQTQAEQVQAEQTQAEQTQAAEGDIQQVAKNLLDNFLAKEACGMPIDQTGPNRAEMEINE
ncbi:NAD(P)-dependent oxidoreductase [Candidatus Haliotispira prima]|uniref:precorrin-2 dehydrogenase n=1 Tax=Candidatus Haliotispira prima TaxID=3034016 RepID=A0ABY8MDL2_9SPIO|nr:NAD(P)-dependent oxidoreductase [Candidatus Haliotispira prima]